MNGFRTSPFEVITYNEQYSNYYEWSGNCEDYYKACAHRLVIPKIIIED